MDFKIPEIDKSNGFNIEFYKLLWANQFTEFSFKNFIHAFITKG